MSIELSNYNYSKQFILLEDELNVIMKNLKKDSKVIDNLDFQWKIITSVTQKNYNDQLYSYIQLDDQKVGWLNLQKSIQIFRFKPKSFKLIEDKYYSDELNSKLDFEKDFYSAFEGKLLTVKSELMYKGQRYYGVFLKEKFQGFHPASYLDEARVYNLHINSEDIKNSMEFYTVSSLSGQVKEEVDISNIKLVLAFHEKKIAKVQIDEGNMYWTSFDNIESIYNLINNDNNFPEKTEEEKIIDDILYSVEIERNKTKKIVKSVISAKEFINLNKGNADSLNFSDSDEIKTLKDSLKLSEERLESQRDFNNRLAEQKERYKSRMLLVEDKLKALDEKYKALKNK